jgi:hypothetical protein
MAVQSPDQGLSYVGSAHGAPRQGLRDADNPFRVKAVAPGDSPVVVALDETRNHGETDRKLPLRPAAEVVFARDGRRYCPTARFVRFLQPEAIDPSPRTHRGALAAARGTEALRSRVAHLVPTDDRGPRRPRRLVELAAAIAHEQLPASSEPALMLCEGLRARGSSLSALSRWTSTGSAGSPADAQPVHTHGGRSRRPRARRARLSQPPPTERPQSDVILARCEDDVVGSRRGLLTRFPAGERCRVVGVGPGISPMRRGTIASLRFGPCAGAIEGECVPINVLVDGGLLETPLM